MPALGVYSSAPDPVFGESNAPPPAPPDNYVPGSTYVPDLNQEPLYYETAPGTVPSEVYGGPSDVEPIGTNDPNIIVTSYPSTGAEPTAQYTDYMWTKTEGRLPPSNYNREFPASTLRPPEQEPLAAPREDYYKPGPSRDYIPGSSYIPQHPRPDPRIPFEERMEQGMRPGVNPTRVPGSQAYRRGEAVNIPYVSPGLGGYQDGPLSRENRPLTQPTQMWMTGDPREPDHFQPGSTYIPPYPMPPLGDPAATWQPIVPSERYGQGLPENTRPKDKTRVTTTYPMSGAPETARSTGYLANENAQVINHPEATNRERVIGGEPGFGWLPGSHIQDRQYVLWLMEQARRRRQRAELAGLFGGG
jgi:hypothetical protein